MHRNDFVRQVKTEINWHMTLFNVEEMSHLFTVDCQEPDIAPKEQVTKAISKLLLRNFRNSHCYNGKIYI